MLESILISNPRFRCNWDKLFIKYNSIKDTIYSSLLSSIEDDSSEIFKIDDDIQYNKKISNSVLINQNKKNNYNVSQSININTIKGGIIEHDDYRIISRSAPNNLGESYMEHYIKNQTNTNNNNIQILGSSPSSNSSSFHSYLNKSYNTFKNMFNM